MPIKESFRLNDGTVMPWLAIGSGTALYNQDVSHPISQVIRAGITHLDGAQVYLNEQSLGAGILSSGVSRDKLYVTTKLDVVPQGKTVVDTLKESLERLQLSYVDLFLIHNPFQHDDLVGTWKGMEEAQKAGLTKSIGVSNHRVRDIEAIVAGSTVVPAVNQIEYHPYVTDNSDTIIEFCHKHDIVVSAYGGLTSLVRKSGGPVDAVVDMIRTRMEKETGSPVTSAQVLLKWINQRGVVSITTTCKLERIHEYQGVASLPDLSMDDIEQIIEAGHKLHYRRWVKRIDNL